MPASVAEKVLPTTPGPLHVPPAGVAVKITTESVKHTLGGALVKVIFGSAPTVKSFDAVAGPLQLASV